ncbi:YggS family pyridoxal phosphate enzyme [Aureimonas sp. SA4125]|uniref:YggS family pyridoxal phosphate-dependent enzyme n=1 Tax=Aureimonas sp. SA4125 TaxID=2826993 RepID=UPI001CC63E35|nr:YggS family pyridoxal phosphate-dependent enzyme [Aureimonas sp. SA4125]BDA86839.1 YggS family pyridoxal phosphate enzyme [Aureimonas sp. SA4125]
MGETTVDNWQAVLRRIAEAETKGGRPAGSAQLVAVSKTYAVEDIAPVAAAGQRVFGENRVQEAIAKFPALRARFPDIELHLIGPLQSNKAAEAVATFDVIETVDREKIAKALAAEMAKQGRTPRLYVQVNTGAEPQKAGILPSEAVAFVARCRDVHKLAIEGLMCIPPAEDDPAPHFGQLAALAREAGVDRLSMGMSGDYETAIAQGATSVRVGSAIFGARPKG